MSSQPQLEVRGAGNHWANDIWSPKATEEHSGRQVWGRNGNPNTDQIWWEDGKWQLLGDGSLLYQADGGSSTPPTSGWTCQNESDGPAPTLSHHRLIQRMALAACDGDADESVATDGKANAVDEENLVGVLWEMSNGTANREAVTVLARYVLKIGGMLVAGRRVDDSSGRMQTAVLSAADKFSDDLKDHIRLVFKAMAEQASVENEISLSLDRFVETVQNVYQLPVSREVLTELFATVDTNASNSLTIDEFDNATARVVDQVVSLVRTQLGVNRDALILHALLSSLALAAVLVFLGLGIVSFGSTEAFASSVRIAASVWCYFASFF